MKFVVPRDGANAPQTRTFPKLYWFFFLLVLFAAPLTDAMANRGPSTSPVSAMTISKGGGTVTKSLTSIFSDPDGDTLSYSVESSDTSVATAGLRFSTVKVGDITFFVTDKIGITPKAPGKTKITITATDPHGRWARTAFSVTVTNSAPTGSLSRVNLTVAGGAQTVDLSSSFSDPDGDTLSFTASSSHTMYATVSVSGSTLTITPVAEGASDISVTANDGTTSTTVSFLASIGNSRPTGSLSDVTLTAGGGAKTINLSSSFSDPDGDILTFSGGSSNTKVVTASVSGSTLTLTPVAVGSATISVTADDGEVGWVPPHFTVTVVNNAPRGYVPDVTLSKHASTRTINLAHRFTDSDGDTLSFSASSSDTSHVTVSVSGSTLTISKAGSKGTSTITVTANDGTTSTTVTFTAKVLNSVPEGWISDMTLTEGDSARTVDLASSFSDPDGDTISFSASSSNSASVTASVSGTTLTLTPVAEGTSAVTATGNDGEGTGSMTFNVTVNAPADDPPGNGDDPIVNRPPHAVGSIEPIVLTVGDTQQVSASFSDPDGDTLSYSVSGGNSAASAGISGNTVTITAIAQGNAVITVTATDTHDATATQTIDVTVESAPSIVQPNPNAPHTEINNRAPQAVGTINPIVLAVGDSQSIQVQFSDPDGDTLSYSVSGGNSAASASVSGNTVTVTAVAAGEATLTVTATDPHGATATQTIDVTVSQLRQAIPRTATALIKVSGDNQSAPIGSALSEPLVVEVRDGQQRVIQGVPVQFELADIGLALESTPTTDANGQASATLMFGDTTGEFAVEVSVTGVNEPVVFTATAISSSLDVVYIDVLETESNPNDPTMNRVYGVAFSPDGETLASAHGDRTVRMWDVETRELKHTLGGSLVHSSIERRGHQHAAHSVAFSPDGNILASGGRGGRVLLWDTNRGRLKQFMLRHAGTVWSLAFSPDGNTLAAATEGGYVYIYDVSNLRSVERKHRLRAHSERAWSVAFSPDGEFLASSGGDALVRLWDYETGRAKKTLRGHEEQVLSIAFGADNTLASGSADGTVRLWDIETRSSRTLSGHTDWVFGVAFHPNGEILASTGTDMSVRLWDTTFGVPLNTLERHTNWGRDVAISRGGILASAGYDNLIHLWDTGVRSDDAVDAAENSEVVAQRRTAQVLPNFPNPFNPETWIPYQLETASDVSLSIYDVSGRLVRTIELGYQQAGLYANRSDAIYWNGRNNHGEQVASGVYVYRLTAGEYSASRRMVIVK